jgi:subtilase family serine protease
MIGKVSLFATAFALSIGCVLTAWPLNTARAELSASQIASQIANTGHLRATRGGARVWTPPSGIPAATDKGVRAHTNVHVFIPPNQNTPQIQGDIGPARGPSGAAPTGPNSNAPNPGAANPGIRPHVSVAPPYSGYYWFETPASIGCIYKLVATPVAGCNAYSVTSNPSGGSRFIAIVDAYDMGATACTDLTAFSSQFGLRAPVCNTPGTYTAGKTFQVLYASGSQPPLASEYGWDLEESLDIEWSHGMAPNATIFLVEAASNSFTDLQTAWKYAANLVSSLGGGEVSMSFGGGEFSGETSYDSSFAGYSNVVFFASAGDGPGTEYPCVSPNVVCVGGTSILRNTNGYFLQENVWYSDDNTEGTGGGSSAYEARPSFQNYVSNVVGSLRGVPDVAAAADPQTGAWVYNTSSYGGWVIVGGTSWASPTWAGVSNAASNFYANTLTEQDVLYYYSTQSPNGAGVALYQLFTDIISGACGEPGDGAGLDFPAMPSWDFCTGFGTPNGYVGK